MAEAQPRRNLVGITAVVVMGTVLAYCFLPDSMLPIPPVFILIVWIGALASAVAVTRRHAGDSRLFGDGAFDHLL